jgi:ATP-dependent helicase HepA
MTGCGAMAALSTTWTGAGLSCASEVHRVHRRMIRSRRGTGLAADFPVLGRRPPTALRVVDHQAVVQACSVWIGEVLATHEEQPLAPDTLTVATRVAQAASQPGDALTRTASASIRELGAAEIGDRAMALLEEVRDAAIARARACPKVDAGVQRALEALAQDKRVAVAAGSDQVASEVAEQLREAASDATVLLLIAGSEGHPAGDFERLPGPGALVFGSTGEEGQNLQSAEVIVHLNLPWDANRLEQRLGRFDRFGPCLEAEHVVVLGDGETLEDGWFRLLSDGFGIFDRSIASAQQAVARPQPAVDEAALWPDGSRLTALVDRVQQELEEEEKAITSAELLDESVLDDRSRQLLHNIEQAEARAGTDAWRTAVMRWSTGEAARSTCAFTPVPPPTGRTTSY